MRGLEEGAKDRPCAVVLTTRRENGRIIVYVAPVTHAEPQNKAAAVEIPTETKKRLNMDDQRSWIIVSEINSFTWPGYDLRPVDRRDPSRGFVYGLLPGDIIRMMVERLRAQIKAGKAKAVSRD
jgi:mRNA-degrading endonuclease toxin of MazEF toxin-antitoxin module